MPENLLNLLFKAYLTSVTLALWSLVEPAYCFFACDFSLPSSKSLLYNDGNKLSNVWIHGHHDKKTLEFEVTCFFEKQKALCNERVHATINSAIYWKP